MILEECHFEYGDFNSMAYGLIIAHVDTSAFLQASGTIGSSTVYNARTHSNYFIRNDYSGSAISFEMEIVSDIDTGIPLHLKRVIEKALFNRPEYMKLYIDTVDDIWAESVGIVDGEQKRVYLNCRLINPVRIEENGGKLFGYRCTVECDSAYMYQEPVTTFVPVNNGTASVTATATVSIDTDGNEYIYPDVLIQVGSVGGDIIITNDTDDSTRLTKFVGLSPNSSITLKGEINYVSGQYYEKFAYRNFIRLLDGDNEFSVVGNVSSITLTYSSRRFL